MFSPNTIKIMPATSIEPSERVSRMAINRRLKKVRLSFLLKVCMRVKTPVEENHNVASKPKESSPLRGLSNISFRLASTSWKAADGIKFFKSPSVSVRSIGTGIWGSRVNMNMSAGNRARKRLNAIDEPRSGIDSRLAFFTNMLTTSLRGRPPCNGTCALPYQADMRLYKLFFL